MMITSNTEDTQMITFNPTKKGTMVASLFPETLAERKEMINELKGMGFSFAGKVHGDTRMRAVIGDKKHIAVIETIIED